jgi:hypothetical protein
MRHSAIYEQEVDFQEQLCQEIVGSVVAWALIKKMCGSLLNYVMLLSLDFMPLGPNCQHVPEWLEEAQLQLVIKLKLRLRWMKLGCIGSKALGFSYWGPSIVIPLLEKSFDGGSLRLGFFSMRHSAIFEQEVDFQEHHQEIVGSMVTWALAK